MNFSFEQPRMRWHSFQDGQQQQLQMQDQLSGFESVKDDKSVIATTSTSSDTDVKASSQHIQKLQNSLQVVALSCGQLQVLKKLALVTLTGYMEKYCPTHRSGWNWELPKFIRKTKPPDYRGNLVFSDKHVYF